MNFLFIIRCFVDMGRPYGRLVTNIYSITVTICILLNIICYGLVWMKIKQTARAQGKTSTKYLRSAKVMTLFVAAYITQVIPLVIFLTWNMFTVPNVYFAVVVMFFFNMGGVLNFLVYTLIRIKYQRGTEPHNNESVTQYNSATVS